MTNKDNRLNTPTDNEWINKNKRLRHNFDQFRRESENEQARLKADLIIVNGENRWLRQASMALTVTSIILFAIVWFRF